MHIGIDCRLPTYQMGGISRYILHLLPALAALDQENRYTLFHSRKEQRDFRLATPNFHRANLWTPAHHRFERWAMTVELLPHRLDVFHSPDFIPPAGAARRRVITVHDLNFLHFPQYLTSESRRYYNEQIQWAVETADAISADSEHTRQDLIQLLQVPPEKVTTIPLAADPLYQRPVTPQAINATLQRHQLSPGFLLFVGTLEPRKNIPTLLRAYARLRREHGRTVPLVLVGGKGWLHDPVFETIEQLDLGTHVRHLTAVPTEELAHLYHAAGALALPSHYEGFGLPPLEAMHCGCPVVVSNRASLPEVVGPAGILLEPDDEAAWADALNRVLEDEDLRARLVTAGYQQAARFTWEKTAAATLRLYAGGTD